MKTAIYKFSEKSGDWRTVYSPNIPPEEFFDDIVKISSNPVEKPNPPRGYIFIDDRRDEKEKITGWQVENGKNRWVSFYGKPSSLLCEIMEESGVKIGHIGSVEIVEWPDGNILTILRADNHIFTTWAGLNI